MTFKERKERLGRNIAEQMRRADYTTMRLAWAMCVSPKTIRNWVTGTTQPGSVLLADVADILGCTMADLMRGV